MLVIMLSAKYNIKMKLADIAKKMGSLGGKARAKRLSSEAKKAIASLGGRARSQSILAAKRIEQNFAYVAAMNELRGGPIKVKRIKTSNDRLPGIYPNDKKTV
jgi:hypothetical protein